MYYCDLFSILFILSIVIIKCVCLLDDIVKKAGELRHKLKSAVRLKYEGPSDDVRYSPIRKLEYPGKDSQKLANLTDLWNEYYECLEEQYDSLGYYKRIAPIAIMVLEDRNVHLECNLCQSPQQANNPVTWYRLDSPYGRPLEITESENIIISQEDQLSIYRIEPDYAGIYYCQTGDTRSNPYYLHVFGESEELIDVKPSTAPNGPYPGEDEQLYNNLIMTTTWTEWTQCSHCGIVGRKKKFGFCSIKAKNAKNISEKHLDQQLKIDVSTKTKGYLGFLLLFTDGLPCRSRLLPLWIRHNKKLMNRPNEIMTAFCKIKCQDTIFEVKDKFGKLLEAVNNSAGIFSSLQGPPHVIPMISRATYYCPLNKPFTMLCPGTEFIDAPIRWHVNRTIRIIPWMVRNDTKGRIHIDSRERLVFNPIQEEDARIYSCWQGNQIAGIVRVVVYDSNAISIDHHIVLLGIIIILAVFLYLFVRIYLNKTKIASLYSIFMLSIYFSKCT